MAKITPITFPGNLGVANEIKIRVIFDLEDTTAKITYQLLNYDTKEIVSHNTLIIPEDVYSQWGTDNQFIIDWVSSKLGIELIK